MGAQSAMNPSPKSSMAAMNSSLSQQQQQQQHQQQLLQQQQRYKLQQQQQQQQQLMPGPMNQLASSGMHSSSAGNIKHAAVPLNTC